MDPENTNIQQYLDLLLNALPLSPETKKKVREIFNVILNAYRSLFNSAAPKKKPTPRDIEDTAAKLREVIAFFNSADDERDEFIDIFPEWEDHRKESIQKLREIAESMKDSRQISSIAQIVGGSVGVVGGVAIVTSLLFPPAAPAWMAIVPSFLLPAAATSSLAVGGAIAAGAGGVTQVVTSVTEAAVLSNLIDKAKDVCRRDKEIFDRMMIWFEHTQQLKYALDKLFDIDILEIIFADLKDYFGNCDISSMAFRSALLKCFKRTLGGSLSNPLLHIAVTAITFTVFLVQQRNRFLLQWIIVGFGLVAAFNAGPQLGRLVASAFVKDAGLIPKALASKVAVGALAGVGMVLDVTNIVLNSIDLAEGSKSEVQENVLEVAKELQKNLDFIRKVHQKLLNDAKKSSEEFLNSLMVDKLSMRGTVTVIAHEIYQDVLKETRKLRRSQSRQNRPSFRRQVRPSDVVSHQMDPSFNSLRKVIDIFNKADREKEIFCSNFGQWMNKRNENVRNLNLIAKSLQEVRTLHREVSNVDDNEGAAGGTGAWLLQRSQCFVNTVMVTCKTAIDHSNATRLITQVRERTEKASRLCRRDREDLLKLEGWFLRIHQLIFAYDDLFSEETFNNICMDLRTFCGGGLDNYRYNRSHEVQSCVRKIFDSRSPPTDPSFQEAVIAIVCALLLDVHRSLRTYFSSLMINRSRFRERGWTSDFATYLDKEESVLQTLMMGSVEGRVVLLDTIKTVKKLANTDESALSELADELQGQLNSIKNVYGKFLL